MLLVAFAPRLWAATLRTLRELTRLAMTALVLAVGLGGGAAASATTALQPTVVTSRVAELRVDQGPAAERASQAPGEPATGAPTEREERREAGPRPATPTTAAPTDPGRDAVGRRGPPRG